MSVALSVFAVWLVGGLGVAVRRRGAVAAVEALLPDLVLGAAVLCALLWATLVP